MITAKKELRDVPISDLTPYERNPRKNDEAVKKVAASLEQFGLVKNSVVVDENMVLITGHTTTKAMQSLGWTTCPAVTQVFGLTEEEKVAYRIADNKLGELAEWDLELLAGELTSLDEVGFDAELTGFDISSFETIDRDVDGETSGASPWERMQGAAADGTMLIFGAISVRVTTEVYDQFFARCEAEPDLHGFVEGVLLDACRNP